MLGEVEIGRVYVEDKDDWDLPDKVCSLGAIFLVFFRIQRHLLCPIETTHPTTNRSHESRWFLGFYCFLIVFVLVSLLFWCCKFIYGRCSRFTVGKKHLKCD